MGQSDGKISRTLALYVVGLSSIPCTTCSPMSSPRVVSGPRVIVRPEQS